MNAAGPVKTENQYGRNRSFPALEDKSTLQEKCLICHGNQVCNYYKDDLLYVTGYITLTPMQRYTL